MVSADSRCLICDGNNAILLCSWDRWEIKRCRHCGVLFTLPRPSEDDLVRMYDDGSLQGVSEDGAPFDGIECPPWKQKEHDRILNRMQDFRVRSGRLLDVGCLWGFFLTNAQRRGFEVFGVEPCGKAVRYVRDVLGLTTYRGSLQSADLPAASFDAVSLLDVIEHLPDPVAQLREVYRITKREGLLVIVTPNSDGWLPQVVGIKRKAFRQPWCPIDNVPWHLWGFTPGTIVRCVDKVGFRVEAVEQLQPSIMTTNRSVDRPVWKEALFRTIAKGSEMLRRSDRLIVFARKR